MQPAQRDDEVFDLVDENDNVIGTATRKEVHTQKLFHRAIHVLLFNKADQVFLQKRSQWKDTAPNCWDSSASGHVDSGEAYYDTAIRECEEELGIQIDHLEPFTKLHPDAQNGWEFVEVFIGQHEGPFELNPSEISDGKWFSREKVEDLLKTSPEQCASAFKQVWDVWEGERSSPRNPISLRT